MAGNHFSITFDAKMNVGQVKGAISEMKKGLEQLKLPPELKKGMGDNLTKLANEMKRFEDLTSKPMKSTSDFKALERSGDKILQLYNKIRREASEAANLSPKNMEKFFPASVTTNIEKATAALEKYKAVQASIEDFKKAQKRAEGDFSLDTKEYKDTTTKLKRLQKMEAERNSELEYRKTSNGTRNAYKGKDNATLRKEITEITTEAKKLENTLTTLKMPGMTKAKTEAEELGKVLKDLGFDLENLDKADDINLNNLKSALKDIEGLDSVSTLDDFENIKKVVEGLKPAAAQQLLSSLKQMSSTVESSSGSFDGLEEDIRRTGEAVADADARFRDVSAFKSRIAMFLSFGSAVRLMQRAVRSSFETIKELDATMTETAVVTDFSVGDMWKQLPKYTKMANELGVTTNDAYKAATLYYQQGLSTNQVMAVSNETLKMARIAGIDAADATDYMTAALRGFNMEINEVSAQRVNDVYSKLAAETASDTEELSIAMSKTASIASNANMEFENTAALLAQIIETTREAPETAGTAMKTIIARFSEVKELFSQGQLMGSDEEGEEININKIDAALKGVGISLKSFLRGDVGLDDILLELASKWDTLDLATQRYIATTAAGSRQQSRFLAMMSNYSRTIELTDKAYNAAGAGQEQYEKTLDSMETALNRLKNAWDQFAMGIANSSLLKGGVSGLTGLLGAINQITDGFDGITKSVVNLSLAFGSFQLGRGLFDILTSLGKKDTLQTGAGKTLSNFANSIKQFRKEATALIKTEAKTKEDRKDKRGAFFQSFINNFVGDKRANEKAFIKAFNKQKPRWDEHKTRYMAQEAARAYNKRGVAGLEEFEQQYGVRGLQEEARANFEKTAANAQALGAAASIAGAAVFKLSNALEEAGHTQAASAFDAIGSSLLAAGSTLMMLGTALPALTKAFPALENSLAKIGLTGAQGFLMVAAAVMAVVAAVKIAQAVSKDIKARSLEGQIESTEKAIQRSREAAQHAKEAYDELAQARPQYDKIQDNIKGLTRGTTAWTESLVEANDQVMGLVEKVPGLVGYLEVGKRGQLSINEEGWKYISDYSDKILKNTQYTLLNNQLKQQALSEQKSLNDFVEGVIGLPAFDSAKYEFASQYSMAIDSKKYEDFLTPDFVAKAYAGTPENPSKEAAQLSAKIGKSIQELYEPGVMNQLFKISNDLVAQRSSQQALARNLLNTVASDGSLNYKFSDELFSGLTEYMTTFSYNDSITRAAEQIADVNSEEFSKLADEYGVSYKMEGDTQKDLENLYAVMMGTDVASVRDMKLSSSELSYEIATMADSSAKAGALDGLTNAMRSMDEESQRALSSILSGNIENLTLQDLSEIDFSSIGKELKDKLRLAGLDPDEVMQELGYDSFDGFMSTWNADKIADNYKKNIEKTLGKINKYSEQKGNKNLLIDFEKEEMRLRDFGIEYQSMVNNVLDSLEGAGDRDFVAAGWEAFSKAISDPSLSGEQIKEISDWISNIDWSNPIEGAYALGEAANSSNKKIREISEAMKEAGDSTFDAASQMDYFLGSGDYESIKEDLKDIVSAGEEITGADIRGLTGKYKNLDKMLQNTGISASALGKTLTMINDGTLNESQLTNSVLAAISAYDEAENITASIMESISNFDPGYNEGDIANFVQSSNQAITELINSNLMGSQQIGNYLDYWFGSNWSAGLTTVEEYSAKVKELNGILGQNTQNMASMWDQFAQGKDAFGNAIDENILSGLGFSYKDNILHLDKGTTESDIIKGLQDSGYTKNMAEAMLADMTARSPEVMLDLRNRQLPNAVTRAAEQASELWDDVFVMDDSEVQAIADFFGVLPGEIKKQLQSSNDKITFLDLFDDSGNLESVEGTWDQLGRLAGYKDNFEQTFDQRTGEYSKKGQTAGEAFKKGFNKDGILDLAEFDRIAKKLRIPEEGKRALTQDLASSYIDAMGEGAKSFQYLSDVTGEIETVEIPATFNVENATEEIQALTKSRDMELEAQINADAITSALENLEIHIGIDENGLIATIKKTVDSSGGKPTLETPDSSPVTSAINKGIAAANTKVTLQIGQTGLEGVRSAINAVVNKAYSVTIGVSYSGGTGANGGPIASYRNGNSTQREQHQGKRTAKGVKNASSSYISLTGEEGPELHQLANGGYYITGTTGPSIDYVNRGDTIYTAEETRKIMSGSRRSITRKRFSQGEGGETNSRAYPNSSSGSKSSTSSPSTTSNKAASNSKKTADNTAKAAEDAEKWENSFDHLYNLTQDINAELRTREKLEKQYQRYLKERIPIGKTLAQISKSELYSLEQQRKLQEQMLEARKHDIVATEEEYKDYNQYAHYNWQDQTIEIDWDKINGVTDKDQGEKIEKYIDKLEEIQDQIQEAEDAIDKIYDDIQEIRERGEKANEDLQDKVLDALIDREQKKIDLQEETNRAINDAANDLHDAISRNIEKMRQDRENEKTKEDLAEKERRLAYLRMDTTGGNALEIKQLEKEIKEQREQFNDDLVDQALNNMQEQNEEAADQRQRQIDLLQGVLDFQTKIGYFATRALEIVNAGTKDGIMTKDSELHQLLVDENEDYWEKSVGSRNRYLSDIAKLIAEKYEYDEFIESERNLKNGGYMTQMMNATSAEEFRQAEEARNTYVNNHPEEGYATTGFSQAYKQGQINSIGYNEEDIFGKKDENGFLIAGTGINWQAEIDKAIKEKDWEKAAMMEGYRDLKISRLKANDPARNSAKMTYGSQAATAYANATGSKTASGVYGKAKYQPASHGDLLLLDKAKSKYNSEYSGATETPGSGGYMDLMQKAIADGNFDLAYYYARLRDEKTSTTGKNYGEPDAFQYVYDIEKGYGDNLKKAQNYYQKGFDKGYADGENYMSLIENELSKSNPNWGQAFTYAGQRDSKLQNDPSAKQYSNGKEKETWNYVFKKWPKKFKTGGLVEGTGLAWLDGTPSRPEYVLNAGQTQAFLRLSDMVGNLTSGSNQQLGGDTYINVDINVDQIANDYDVERAAEKVKQIIYQDSMYRNVNRINFLK